MADDVIRAGDLVVVIKPTRCCGDAGMIGDVYRVLFVNSADTFCNRCFASHSVPVAYKTKEYGVDVACLKKIPPDIVTEEEKGEITA